MAESHWHLRPPEEQPIESTAAPVSPVAQRRLSQAIAAKLAAGYHLESQTATGAVLSMPARRYLGITLSARKKREAIEVDRGGRVTTRAL